MTSTYTLQELVERLAPFSWKTYQAVLAVLDGRTEPPTGWQPKMEAIAKAYVDIETAIIMEDYGSSDYPVAARYLGIRDSERLWAWLKEKNDRPQKLAKLRQERRAEYEREILFKHQALPPSAARAQSAANGQAQQPSPTRAGFFFVMRATSAIIRPKTRNPPGA